MSVAQAKRQRSPRYRAIARGVIVRRHRRRLCTAISTNCRPRSNCTQRSCTQLGIISQDPIGFAAGDANLYRYVGNGATTKTDPSGLEDPDQPTPSEGTVPMPWPNAQPWHGVSLSEEISFDWHAPAAFDAWGLPTGIGQWDPDVFFGRSQITLDQTSYGCGGLLAMRAGLTQNRPQTMRHIVGATAFARLSDAMGYLQTELHGRGLITAAETTRPVEPFSTDFRRQLEGNYQCPAKEVNFGGAYNYRTLLGTPDNWYWEHASGPWGYAVGNLGLLGMRKPGIVLHDQSGFPKSVVFIVIPDAASNSPLVPSLMESTE